MKGHRVFHPGIRRSLVTLALAVAVLGLLILPKLAVAVSLLSGVAFMLSVALWQPSPQSSRVPAFLKDGRVPAALAWVTVVAGMIGPASWAVAGLASGVLLLALAHRLARRQRTTLLGPLFRWECVRLARSSRTTALRCFYAVTVLAVLYAVHGGMTDDWWFGLGPVPVPLATEPGDLARLGEAFAFTLLGMQNVAVLALTPVYVCGTIIDERNRGTLDFLFATHLDDHEIVLGKLAARVLSLAMVLLAGLPVLALLQLWGGVSVYVLVGGFAVTLVTLVQVGSLAICASVLNRHLIGALAATYALLAVSTLCCIPSQELHFVTPFAFLAKLDASLRDDPNSLTAVVAGTVPPAWSAGSPELLTLNLVGQYALFHGALTLVYLTVAVCRLRARAETLTGEPHPGDLPLDLFTGVAPGVEPPRVPVPRALAGIGEHPLWWRETRVRPGSFAEVLAVLWMMWSSLYFVYWFIFFLAHLLLLRGEARPDLAVMVSNPLIRFITLTGVGVPLCAVGFQAAGSVTREREGRTLEQLLLLPGERWHILGLKWLGSIWRYRWALAVPALVWLTGCLTPALHPLAALLLPLAVAVHAAFFASLGVCLSVYCRSSLQANLAVGTVVLVTAVLPWFWFDGPAASLNVMLNPAACWLTLCWSWEDPVAPGVVLAAAYGLGVYALLAALLWLLARRRFVGREARLA